eukprot:403376731
MNQTKQVLTVLSVAILCIFTICVTGTPSASLQNYLQNSQAANSAARINEGGDNDLFRDIISQKDSETLQFKHLNPHLIEQIQQANYRGKQQTNFTDGKEHMKWLQKITEEARLKYIQKLESEIQLVGRIANQQSQKALYNQGQKLPTFKSIEDQIYQYYQISDENKLR